MGGLPCGEEAPLTLRLALLVGIPLVVVLVIAGVALALRPGCAGVDGGDAGGAPGAGPVASVTGEDASDGEANVATGNGGLLSDGADGAAGTGDAGTDAEEGPSIDADGMLEGLLDVWGTVGEVDRGCDPEVANGLGIPPSCLDGGRLIETAQGTGMTSATWAFDEELPTVMTQVLEGLQDVDGLRLTFGSYLDLFQRAWGGVVMSDEGWSEIVVGQEVGGEEDLDDGGDEAGATGGGEGVPAGPGEASGQTESRLTVVRLGPEALARLAAAGGSEGGDAL